MAKTSAAQPSVEETLAQEAEQRPRAGIASIVAGVAILLGAIFTQAIFSDRPPILLIDGLREGAGLPLQDGRTGLRTSLLQFLDEKAASLLAIAAMVALGHLLIALVLGYLYRAAKARRPETPFYALVAAISGAVMYAVGVFVAQVVIVLAAKDFVSAGDFSTAAGNDALDSPILVAAQLIQQLGIFGLALGLVLISLQAMRVGLLTRFIGILGIIAGALFILPLGGGLPIVLVFWLIALGFVILGRWPNGVPPAWSTGRAQPWPSQQQVREQRERERSGGAPAAPAATLEADDDAVGKLHPSSKKRRKKKR